MVCPFRCDSPFGDYRGDQLIQLDVDVGFLIVGNTLRFNVQANKEEIQTMKLIGATDAYILRPYLYSGMWFGLLGAWLLGY